MNKLSIIARAGTMLAAVSAMTVAVTFAALTSTATLTNNTISSATADLLVASGVNLPTTDTDTGFTITNLVPGGAASGPHAFKLKNNGTVDLGVSVYATPSTVTGTLNNAKVHFCFTRVTGGPSTQCFTYAQMLALFNTLPGGPILVGSGDISYNLSVSMDADAITGENASVASFSLVFTGTQQ